MPVDPDPANPVQHLVCVQEEALASMSLCCSYSCSRFSIRACCKPARQHMPKHLTCHHGHSLPRNRVNVTSEQKQTFHTIDLAVGPLPNVKVSQISKAAGSDRYRTFYFRSSHSSRAASCLNPKPRSGSVTRKHFNGDETEPLRPRHSKPRSDPKQATHHNAGTCASAREKPTRRNKQADEKKATTCSSLTTEL